MNRQKTFILVALLFASMGASKAVADSASPPIEDDSLTSWRGAGFVDPTGAKQVLWVPERDIRRKDDPASASTTDGYTKSLPMFELTVAKTPPVADEKVIHTQLSKTPTQYRLYMGRTKGGDVQQAVSTNFIKVEDLLTLSALLGGKGDEQPFDPGGVLQSVVVDGTPGNMKLLRGAAFQDASGNKRLYWALASDITKSPKTKPENASTDKTYTKSIPLYELIKGATDKGVTQFTSKPTQYRLYMRRNDESKNVEQAVRLNFIAVDKLSTLGLLLGGDGTEKTLAVAGKDQRVVVDGPPPITSKPGEDPLSKRLEEKDLEKLSPAERKSYENEWSDDLPLETRLAINQNYLAKIAASTNAARPGELGEIKTLHDLQFLPSGDPRPLSQQKRFCMALSSDAEAAGNNTDALTTAYKGTSDCLKFPAGSPERVACEAAVGRSAPAGTTRTTINSTTLPKDLRDYCATMLAGVTGGGTQATIPTIGTSAVPPSPGTIGKDHEDSDKDDKDGKGGKHKKGDPNFYTNLANGMAVGIAGLILGSFFGGPLIMAAVAIVAGVGAFLLSSSINRPKDDK